jgi:DNA (cytosine-5)-methyltransferase 1
MVQGDEKVVCAGGAKSSLQGRPTCIDIYCGAGGSTYGAMQAGLHVAYGLDRDASAVRTFARNHPDAYADCRDVASVTAREILELSGVDHIDYFLSGPNCQGVSQMGLFWRDDPKNLMFVHLARLLDEFIALGKKPSSVIIENVPSIAFQKNVRIVQDLVKFFLDRKYKCAADVVNFATWGLPQLRHRFILIATLSGENPRLPVPVASLETGEGLVTAWDAISDLTTLPPVPSGETVVADQEALTLYQVAMRRSDGVIHNHHKGRTADIDIERIKRVPPGGCWKDIPADLLPDRFRKVRMTDYKTLYGRMLKGHPAYTIYSAYGNVTSGCFTHPEHDRPLTVREGCRLQGFPDEFVVTGSVSSQYRQIGNAVPAYAAKMLIEHWERVLKGEHPDSVPMRLDEVLLYSEPLRLPVLTPRYTRIGYGTGTYWPKGWGEEPNDLPTASSDYRISTDPVNYRRTRWRSLRDERMTESLCQVADLDWRDFLAAIGQKPGIAVLLDGIDTSDSTPGAGKDLARQRFMRFLAPAGAAVSSLAVTRGKVTVHCDFGLTAGWLFKFLGYLTEEWDLPIRVVNEEVTDSIGPENARYEVILTTSTSLAAVGSPSALVLAHPFTGMNGFNRDGARILPVPGDVIRATLLASYPFVHSRENVVHD